MTRWVAIGDIAALARTPVEVDPTDQYLPIGVRGFGRGLISYPGVAGSELGKLRYFDLGSERLVVSNIKGWEGAVAITQTGETGRIASNRFLQYAIDADAADLKFLLHWFVADRGLAALGSASPGSADRNRTLSIKNFEAIRVPLPSLGTQRRIAAYLDAVTLDNPDRTEMSRLSSRIVIQAAKGAPTARLGELFAVDREWIELNEGESYSPIGVRGFGRGIIHYSSTPATELSKMRYFLVQPDRLLVSNIKAWEGAVTLTRQADRGRVASNRFLQYRALSPEVTAEWAFRWLASPKGTAAMSAVSPGSADRNRTLSMASLEAVVIPVPPPGVQACTLKLLNTVDTARRLAQKADALRTALLPAARNEIFSSMR